MVTRKSCALREEQGSAPPMKSRRRNEKTGITCFFMSKNLPLFDHGFRLTNVLRKLWQLPWYRFLRNFYLTNVPQKLISASRMRGLAVGLKCSRLLNRIYLTVVSGLANPCHELKLNTLSDSAISSPVGGCQGWLSVPRQLHADNLPRASSCRQAAIRFGV